MILKFHIERIMFIFYFIFYFFDPDPLKLITDPDPAQEGQKCYGTGSDTLV
jgi:hypothetical protein